jgi:integral membrane protein (TIGR01906 family)
MSETQQSRNESFPAAPPLEEPRLDLALPLGIQRVLQACIVLSLPVMLVLLSVRLVMTEQFLQIEYNRPGFPEDSYGFTTEDRLEYGPYGVLYLTNNEPISYLADLEINGATAFNARELKHMEDVQVVTHAAFQVLLMAGAVTVFCSVLLARRPSSRVNLFQAWRWGGQLTIALMIAGLLAAVVAWEYFFDTFHEIFFADGTWQFYRGDTLIRLYPEQFWFDAAISIGVLTILGAMLLMAAPWFWKRWQNRANA